jgi:hypothetical protein
MKTVLYTIILVGILSLTVFGQTSKPKTSPLPAGIATWSGEYSDKLLNNAVIKARLKKLLGGTNYAAFTASFETLTPISKDGDILFASGCLIHACGHLESAIAIDVKNNIIHAAIFNEEKLTRIFSERQRTPVKSILDWARNLEDIKTSK